MPLPFISLLAHYELEQPLVTVLFDKRFCKMGYLQLLVPDMYNQFWMKMCERDDKARYKRVLVSNE